MFFNQNIILSFKAIKKLIERVVIMRGELTHKQIDDLLLIYPCYSYSIHTLY